MIAKNRRWYFHGDIRFKVNTWSQNWFQKCLYVCAVWCWHSVNPRPAQKLLYRFLSIFHKTSTIGYSRSERCTKSSLEQLKIINSRFNENLNFFHKLCVFPYGLLLEVVYWAVPMYTETIVLWTIELYSVRSIWGPNLKIRVLGTQLPN